MEKWSYTVLQRIMRLALVSVMAFFLVACQSEPGPAPVLDSGAGVTDSSAGIIESNDVVQIEPLPLSQALAPVRIAIPELGTDLPIIPMGWRVIQDGGERTTAWVVPQNEVGWHVNSAGVGGTGNMILSGRQADGATVFAPLALGNVVEGQYILVTDSDGLTFVYRVVEVSEPIPISGATDEEEAQAMAYAGSEGVAQLTLITGWPDFTTTHRVYAVADFAGVIK